MSPILTWKRSKVILPLDDDDDDDDELELAVSRERQISRAAVSLPPRCLSAFT